jgi:hypothetical protein
MQTTLLASIGDQQSHVGQRPGATGESRGAERMLGDLTGSHLAGVAFDDDEGDAVGTGNSAKAHSPEPSGGRERGEAGRSGPTPRSMNA